MPHSRGSPSCNQMPTMLIMLYMFRIITTLPLLISLVWHVSTIFLVEHFDMPPAWEKDFTKLHLQGWRASIWAMMFTLVPLDLGFALWSMGRVSETTSNKIDEHASRAGTSTSTLQLTSRRRSLSTTSKLQKLACPSSSPHRRVRFLLVHIAVHILAVTLYISHMYSYATNLQPSVKTCRQPHFHDEWLAYVKLHPKQKFTFRDRCQRINWSIWVAGGFSCAAALMVSLLHLATVATKLWALVSRHCGQSEGGGGANGDAIKDKAGDEKLWDVVPRDFHVKLRGGTRSNVVMGTVSQGESGLKRRRNSETNSRENKKSEGGVNDRKADTVWHEVLLECLVP